MEKEQLLRNPDIYPADEVLAAALGDSYNTYKAFTQKLPELSVEPEWRYYNDGKAWLGKCVHKKKTVFWLSVWDGFFKVSIFFTGKTCDGVYELPIHDDLKTRFANEKPIGRLIPLVLEVGDKSALADVYALIEYKRSIK